MPEMEGIETLLVVRGHFPAIPVIAMSGGGRTGNVDFLETAGHLGAAAMLQKPFTYDALLKAINLGIGGERVA